MSETTSAEDALQLAIRFHETYERLAPSFGYETRTETRAFDPTTPNGRLMQAVCGELLAALAQPAPAAQPVGEVAEWAMDGHVIVEWAVDDVPIGTKLYAEAAAQPVVASSQKAEPDGYEWAMEDAKRIVETPCDGNRDALLMSRIYIALIAAKHLGMNEAAPPAPQADDATGEKR